MWYEILPVMGIIVGCTYVVPQVVPYFIEKKLHGNPLRRDFSSQWTTIMTGRDEMLTGSYKKLQGLEAIPDN